MNDYGLTVQGLTKKIGSKTIVNDVSFDVKKGEIFGLLGPNGAGKTTIIRMIVGLINRTAGKVIVNGHDLDVHFTEALNEIGAIVENPEFYGYMTGYKNLIHYKRMSQKDITDEKLQDTIKLVKLDHAVNQKVKTYSLGMRQRLGVAQAILHTPSLLILDEPTNGLDPSGIREFRDHLRMLANNGISVLVSSHLLSEMQLMCDRFAIIDKGKLIHIESMQETTNMENDLLREVTFTTNNSESASLALASKTKTGLTLEILNDTQFKATIDYQSISEINKLLVQSDIHVYEISSVKKTLEDRFMELTNSEREVSLR
ncbi:ABC transporter ATP-binding protein [Lederbergia lenta]|uniref:ABC transporter-like protein n=1 Tax=Lederbergia lenta TaxID=1467 RepID=A0A2X4W081_LEDLE|nr:ATP-binding cassette domain-containing protein [Lederbergia lenta]MCM3111441.1 ATP-binding cassette domain-containing protein [Lederbergia lenta]MEC2325173.1 ATP-binding cassette domain-containing protein [Lederbergia lenta]SQI56079.1 ABC transporter-like protein [Lederbergia lenta]